MTERNGSRPDRRRRKKPRTSTGAATTGTTAQGQPSKGQPRDHTATPQPSRRPSTSQVTSSAPPPSDGSSSGLAPTSAAEGSRSSAASPSQWEGGSLTLVTPSGTSLLRLGYVDGFDRPCVVLDDRAVGVLVSEADGDALMNFVTLAAMLDPANLVRPE